MIRSRHIALAIALLMAAAALGAAPAVWAAEVRIEAVTVGIGGHYKVGHWTPVVVKLAADAPVTGQLVLTTADSEGLSARYVDAGDGLVKIGPESVSQERCVKFGNTRPTLVVEFLVDNAVVARRELGANKLPEGRLSTSELVVAIGPNIGTRAALRFRPYRTKRTTHVVELDSLDELPRSPQALDAVDVLTMSTGSLDVPRSSEKLAILNDWIRLGGRAVISCGQQGEQLFATGAPLAPLAPGAFDRVASLRRSVALESFAGSTQRLGADVRLEQALFKSLRGQVVVGEDVGGEQRPLIVHYPVGFGQVSLVTIDLDQAPLDDWSGRAKLLARVLAFHQPGETGKGTGNKGASLPAQLGYHDLAGQLRMALDQFSGTRLFAFSWVAGLIALYIVLIGPADYVFVRFGLRRMQTTWLTLGAIGIGFILLAWWVNGRLKSPAIAMNEASILDIDLASGTARGTAWMHLYSPLTAAYDLDPQIVSLDAETASPPAVVSWQGLPGTGLGGLDGRAAPMPFDSPYLILAAPGHRRTDAALQQVPVQTAATKAFVTEWSQQVPASSGASFRVSPDGLIEGQYTFPFDMELTDCYAIYDRFLFKILGAVKQGRTIELSDTSSSRNLLYHLTQKQVIDAKEIVTPWNARSTDAGRILEIMMLHEAAGGDNYTGLTQRYFSRLDLSDHLVTGRAMLVGRSERPIVAWQGEPLEHAARDQSWTMVRVVIPVVSAVDSN